MFGSDRLYTKFNFYLDELEVISVPYLFSVDSESRCGLKDAVGEWCV